MDRRIADEKVSVRDAESIVANGNGKHRPPPPRTRRAAEFVRILSLLERRFTA